MCSRFVRRSPSSRSTRTCCCRRSSGRCRGADRLREIILSLARDRRGRDCARRMMAIQANGTTAQLVGRVHRAFSIACRTSSSSLCAESTRRGLDSSGDTRNWYVRHEVPLCLRWKPALWAADPKVVLADYLLKTFGRQAVRNGEIVGSIARNPKFSNALTFAHKFRFPSVPDCVFVSLTKAVCALSVM